MAELVLAEFVTLDGVMQGFGSVDEDRDGGFELGGWGPPYGDEAQLRRAVESLPSTAAYLFGRRTYEKMAQFWPHQPDTNPIAAHLNRTVKYVASRTLDEAVWANSQLLQGELVPSVEALKARHEGTVVVLGSGVVAEQLVAADLVDGYRLFVHPIVLGTGKRLFRSTSPRRLRLVDVTPTSTGVVMLTYQADR